MMKHKTIILCGSSRAGKSTLAKLARKYSRRHKGLMFEGLFPAYLSRYSYFLRSKHKGLFLEYMERPRFIDENKSKTITPAEDLGLRNYIYDTSLLSSLKSNFGDEWIIADLHAELYYKKLLRSMPDLHFIVVLRDPRDCVCAALYWQDYPDCAHNRKSMFYKALYSWILSYEIAKRIKQKHPDNITIINSNKLRSDKILPEFLEFDESWKEEIAPNAYYTYQDGGVFTVPEGNTSKLLSASEILIIERFCKRYMNELCYKTHNQERLNPLHAGGLGIKLMLLISKLSPSLARGFIDLLFSPGQHAKKQVERLKQFIKDIKNF